MFSAEEQQATESRTRSRRVGRAVCLEVCDGRILAVILVSLDFKSIGWRRCWLCWVFVGFALLAETV